LNFPNSSIIATNRTKTRERRGKGTNINPSY
jgi:hypothetical protein